MDVLSATAATIALILVVFRLLNLPDENVVTGREWGLYAAAAAIAGAFAGSWWAQRDESAPAIRPHPEIRRMPVPPANAAPEQTTGET
jgi:uncharacterized membrane protein YfcA